MSGILQKFIPGFAGSGIFGRAFGAVTDVIPGGLWSTILSRNTVRIHFPKPNETKRIRVHGWKKRLSTAGGKRVIMRRLLKGRHALSH